jgi:hypothetical protein
MKANGVYKHLHLTPEADEVTFQEINDVFMNGDLITKSWIMGSTTLKVVY